MTGHGAACVDRLSIRDEGNSAGLEEAQGNCDLNNPNVCHECTSTHRGVLTCVGGFCAVRPGDWCKSGWSCRDDCNCCKKDRKRGTRAVEASESTAEVRTIPKGEPAGTVHKLDGTYGSCPKEFWGNHSCRDNNSVIVVCDPSDSQWRSVGKCAGGDFCCEARRDNPESAQCKC